MIVLVTVLVTTQVDPIRTVAQQEMHLPIGGECFWLVIVLARKEPDLAGFVLVLEGFEDRTLEPSTVAPPRHPRGGTAWYRRRDRTGRAPRRPTKDGCLTFMTSMKNRIPHSRADGRDYCNFHARAAAT